MSNDLRSRAAKASIGFLLLAATLVAVACQSTPATQGSRSQAAPSMPPLSPGDTETLYFEPGSSALSASQLATLRTLAGRLEPHPTLRVHVVGYSDSSSQETTDPWLSEKRAKNIAAYLSSQNLPVRNVTLEGVGQSSSDEPPANPRRAVITVR